MDKKRKLREEDKDSFEDPWIVYQRINRSILEGKLPSQEERLNNLKLWPSQEENLKDPPLSEPLREGKPLLDDMQEEPSHGRAANHSTVNISDFGPSYLYYGVVQSCARMAMTEYNKRKEERSPYNFVKIDTLSRTLVNGVLYKMTFQAERYGEFATFQAQVSVTRRGTKVGGVKKIAKQDSAITVGHQTGGKSDTETCNYEAPAKKKIKRPVDRGSLVLKQRISRRGAIISGKQKELSPQDAAVNIQRNFRAYMIRRSHALRALRELANAKTKLNELRKQFNDFTYRRRVALDVEDRQRLSEKIIVLLLAVNDIEGVDLMVKSARKSMVDKLKSMITDVDRGSATC